MASISVHTIVACTLASYLVWAVAISNIRFHRVWSLALCLLDLAVVAALRASSLCETVFLFVLVAILAGFCFLLSPFYAFFQKKRPYTSKSLDILWPRDGDSSADDIVIDIVAVHGLASNPETAWDLCSTKVQLPSAHHIWLRDSLPMDVPQARIITFNHNTFWQSGALNKSMRDHANDLLNALRRIRKQHTRPIVFVGHSFGGLLVKQALINANEDRMDELNDGIIKNTRGFIFLGVPHRGSRLTFIGELASAFGYWRGSSTGLLEVLRPHSHANEALNEGFYKILQNGCGNKNTVCVFEAVSESLYGFSIAQVVSKESATIDGSMVIGFNKRHRDLQRMISSNDECYQDLAHWLGKWTGEATNAVKASRELNSREATLEQSKSIQSLAFPDMHQRMFDVTEETARTCSWVFDHPIYVSWHQRKNGLLWIKGKPGAGKSTLMKHIIKTYQCSSQCLVASYFITGHGTEIQKTATGTYRALLHQIFERYPGLCSEFSTLYIKRLKAMGDYGSVWTWHESEVKEHLRKAVLLASEQTQTWLFVDALDEAGDEEAVCLLHFFLQLSNQAGGRLKICVSSRHYPLTEITHDLSLIIENYNTNDIAIHLDAELRKSLRDQSKAVQLHTAILEQASGVFQWAFLVLPRIIRACNEGKRMTTLLEMILETPQELDLLYQSLFRDVKSHEKAMVLRLMRWICFSTDLLSLTELRHAMTIESVSGHLTIAGLESCNDFVETDRDMWRWATHLSRGLVAVKPLVRETSYFDDSTRRIGVGEGTIWLIQPNHQSVKDFVSKGGLSWLDNTSPQDEAGAANYAIAESTIRYMAASEIFLFFAHTTQKLEPSAKEWFAGMRTFANNKASDSRSQLSEKHLRQVQTETSQRFPLLQYACHNWISHAQQTDISSHGQRLGGIHRLFQWPSSHLTYLYCCMVRVSRGPCPSTSPPLIHLAADHGMFHMVQGILREGILPYLNTPYGHRTPLSLAIRKDHMKIARFLLETGKVDRRDTNPVVEAACRGDTEMVRSLLDDWKIGRNANGSYDPALAEALGLATACHHVAVVHNLLERGIPDLDAGLTGTSVLHEAATTGDKAVVKLLLLKNRPRINTKDHVGATPLHLALDNRHREIAKMLLNAEGIAVNTRTDRGETPLHMATRDDDTEMIQLLLSMGAKPLAKNNQGRMAIESDMLDDVISLSSACPSDDEEESRPGKGCEAERSDERLDLQDFYF